MEDLSDYRKSYEKSALLETSIPEDPINLFHKWFHEVEDFGGIEEVNAITNNPNVCLSFFWHSMERQVIIKGIAEKTPTNISDGYFESRPDGSKLGAIVSNQSEVIPSRAILEDKLKQLELDYQDKEIIRPEFWGGFQIKPVEVEFWQGRPNRLHDRIRYQLQEDFSWKKDRLSP
jgi:pyridoxamine 5'-phosphate oxidase